MSTRPSTKSGFEPIPGYILRKRLGAGGYGEVWLADAPGGLQKAIKLIYGNVDQSHATSELRSLQRIRQVYHPFLLSIERIEIVDSQVIIVTELAESSLLDRYEQCRHKGAPGIERAQLLDFMRDAADALDFLSQKHALQHLDVKPGNLLIIADRIKVADFGLIKDLHDQNQSLVSGLTPTYSAPEIFDGRPDYRSDQYSLGIVYMEMLAGQLPFKGKSMGELARQHLTQQPELDALPPADRAILARALAKNPLDRYGTCRQFVEHLMKTRGAVLPVSQFRSSSSDESSDLQSTDLEDHQTLIACPLHDRQTLQPAIDTRGLAMHWNNSRAMFIGLGGIGGLALQHVRQLAEQDCDNRLAVDDHGWAVIDTDGTALDSLTCEDCESRVPARYAFELPIFHPTEYRHAEPELFCPLSRRWLYNIPRSLKTEGVRPLAILALLHKYAALRNRLSKDLDELIRQHEQDADCQEPLRIYLLASLHGGTGSALLAEVGFMVRRILAAHGFNHYRLCGIVSAATTASNANANLYSAAAISTLSELTFLMDGDHEVAPLHFGDTLHSAASNKPLDWVTLVEGGLHGQTADAQEACKSMATVAWLDAQSALGAALADVRLDAVQQSSSSCGWLQSAVSSPLRISPHLTESRLARWCCEQTLTQTYENFVGPSSRSANPKVTAQCSLHDDSADSGESSLTAQACNDFTKRLLAELGVHIGGSSAAPDSDVLAPPAGYSRWTRRLAMQADVVSAQLAEDGTTWKNAIARIIKLRAYTWHQIAQIQLQAIEAMMTFYEQNAVRLSSELCRRRLLAGRSEDLSTGVCEYLKRFSQQCLSMLQDFQRDGRLLANKIHGWCASIAAEKALEEPICERNLSGLPPKTLLLANRVRAVLETTIYRMAAQQVGMEKVLLPSEVGDVESTEASFDLKYMLSLSATLTSRLASEMGISPEELNGTTHGEKNRLSFQQISNFTSSIVQGGRQLYRCVITPAEQEQLALQALKCEQLDSTTTVIVARRSLESFVVSEAIDIQLPQLVNALWRPCRQTLQLAERLRTRVDVEWYPATRLLEVSTPVHSGATSEAVELSASGAAGPSPGSIPPGGLPPGDLPLNSLASAVVN